MICLLITFVLLAVPAVWLGLQLYSLDGLPDTPEVSNQGEIENTLQQLQQDLEDTKELEQKVKRLRRQKILKEEAVTV